MEGVDYSAFERLFKKHNKELRNLAYNIVRDKDASKDIVQEVFLRLWKNRAGLDLNDSIKHYLYKATAHTALNHVRFSKKIVKLEEGVLENTPSPTLADGIDNQDLELRIRKAIDRLPAKCRAIYILSRHEGLKYHEIADSLNLSIKTVENQVGIALEKLREDLKSFLTLDGYAAAILIGWGTFYFIFKIIG